MSALVDVVFPLKTVSALNCREHWAAKARRVKRERSETWAALLQLRSAPTRMACVRGQLREGARLVVLLERHSRGVLDDDNLRGAMKGVRDEVAVWLGVDDRDPRVCWNYVQARAPAFAVRITITPADEEADAQ